VLTVNSLSGFGSRATFAPPFTNIQADDWIGTSADHADLGDGTVRMTALDKNVHTSLTFIAADEDFDFQATYADSSTSYIIMGWGDAGTSNTVQNPDSSAPNPHTQDFGNQGYKYGSNTFDTSPSAGWMSNRVNGISRRGNVFYGLADGSHEHTWHSSNNTTAAGMFYFGQGGGNLWTFVATDVQYRKAAAGGLPALAT
tara:strand:+ start:106 stop:702 length:597 start_codon:yes stop_codon:yes gene_type:complete